MSGLQTTRGCSHRGRASRRTPSRRMGVWKRSEKRKISKTKHWGTNSVYGRALAETVNTNSIQKARRRWKDPKRYSRRELHAANFDYKRQAPAAVNGKESCQ